MALILCKSCKFSDKACNSYRDNKFFLKNYFFMDTFCKYTKLLCTSMDKTFLLCLQTLAQ